jgi:hypothetical protein
MQYRVGNALREFYKTEQEVPQGLLVLLMEMEGDQPRADQAEQQHRQAVV